jgi:hypothetical protein
LICSGTFAPRAETDRPLVAELRRQILAPEAIAKIEARVRDLLADIQRRANDGAKEQAARIAALEAEIDRLADAIAQVGLSPALRNRLAAAEKELVALHADAPLQIPAAIPVAIRTRIREVSLQLESALGSDVPVARAILQKKLGDIVVQEKDDGVFAQMDIGPVLLEAAGADVAALPERWVTVRSGHMGKAVSMDQRNTSANLSLGGVRHEPRTSRDHYRCAARGALASI